jgi:electron-transferring-flavoprotein dehydrogenase
MQRESMDYDVVIIGGGPSGLSTAIRLMQLAQENEQELTVCLVEKGSEVGAHILSGAVIEDRALVELFPDYKEMGAPLNTAVTKDEVYILTSEKGSVKTPNWVVPKPMHNDGNFVVSLANVVRWLGEQAEALGVEIYPGFSAAEYIVENTDMYMQGMELRGKYTVFAEGCHGHLGKELIAEFKLDEGKDPQHYGLGIKELWDIPAEQHQEGLVVHGAGWPLSESDSSGGFFLYHTENNQVSCGLITDLSYTNPHLSPFDEFQRLKHHPVLAKHLAGGKRVSYGARAIVKGGLNCLPKMTFPGGLVVGCDAGTLNFAKIKGTHTAMKSGMVAAEEIVKAFKTDRANDEITEFKAAFEASWVYEELKDSRNFGPAMHKFGMYLGAAFNFVDQNLFKIPVTLHDTIPDHATLKLASECKEIVYPKSDGKLSFAKLDSVFIANVNHAEDQPTHLRLKDASIPIGINLPKYNEPAQRYCPAGVYEIVEEANGDKRFQINSQNCVHCKTCDIKDPSQNITWVTPEGSGGPNYPNM